jgi:hypothetical protein
MSNTHVLLASGKQVGMIKGLLHSKGLLEASSDLAMQYSNGRTTHISELTKQQANELIKALVPSQATNNMHAVQAERCNQMRRKIISMARQMGWHTTCPNTGRLKANMERIENWCQNFSYLHKGLNQYTYQELPQLVSQFTIVYNAFVDKL